MRGTREQVAERRRLIVETASRLFRVHGFDGVTVAEIMRAAGVTHGGFYVYFDSKAALAVEASRYAFDRSVKRWASVVASSNDPLTTIIGHYLSRAHADNAGDGCMVPALCAEVARRDDPDLVDTFGVGIEALAAELAAARPDPGVETAFDDALFQLSALAGAVILARSVRGRPLADRILAATASRLDPKPQR